MATWQDIYETENVWGDGDSRDTSSIALQSQYSTAAHLRGIMGMLQSSIAIEGTIGEWFKKMFDLRTATGAALDIWGIILDLPRNLMLRSGTYDLDDETYRMGLWFKAAANIGDETLDSLTHLYLVFAATNIGDMPSYVSITEVAPMTLRYRFYESIEKVKLELFIKLGVLTKADGVGWQLLSFNNDCFGWRNTKQSTWGRADNPRTREEHVASRPFVDTEFVITNSGVPYAL